MRSGSRGAGDARVGEGAGDAGDAVSGEALGEDPGDDGASVGVGVEALDVYAAAGQGTVGVGAGVDEPVTVRGAAAEIAALVAGLHGH